MFEIGIAGFFIIVIVILLIIGPDRLSPMISALIKGIRNGFSDDVPDHSTDQNSDAK